MANLIREERPWGHFDIVYRDEHTWTKILYINPGQKLSLQYHDYRLETWVALDKGLQAVIGEQTIDLLPDLCYAVPIQTAHRIINDTEAQARVLEVAVGQVRESDIVRLMDSYGRSDESIDRRKASRDWY